MTTESPPPRVLVTGALGNVGREVVAACRARGLPVRAAGTRIEPLAERFPEVEHARLDFLDRATWADALAGCRRLFLLRPPAIADMANTLNPFVDAARAAGVEHVVFLSVAGAERMSWVPHRKVELHLEAGPGSWTVLRPGFFAQNLQDAYRLDIVEDGRLYVPAGRGRVAFLDVRDAAEVAVRVFEDPEAWRGRALTLTGPAAVEFGEVAAALSERLGRPIAYEPASILGYAWHLRRRRGLAWMQILVQTILHVGLRRGDAETVDPTVERVLGRPAHSVDEYIDANVAIWQRP